MNSQNRLSNSRVAFRAALAMISTAFASLAIGTALTHQTQTAPPFDARAWFEKGTTALQSGDLPAAESDFHHVLALDPNSGAAYVNLGVIAMRRTDWNEALKNFNQAEN